MARAGRRPARAFAASLIDILKANKIAQDMGRDISGQTALAGTTQSARSTATVTVGGGFVGPWSRGVGVGGAYCDCAQVVLELWGRMIWKADRE